MKILMFFLAIGTMAVTFQTRADEKMSSLQTELSNTTLSGYVDSSVTYNFSPEIQPTPEPSSIALLAMGFVAAAFIIKIRRKQGA
jgi:hypothetical protein